MLPIDPAELSAYLDGELTAERAEEIRAALARDPELRATYEQLASCHADWSTQAASARFQPNVRLGPAPVGNRLLVAVVVVLGLLLLRMGLKFLPPIVGTSLEAALLIFVVIIGLRRVLQFTDNDRDRVLRIGNC